MLHLTAYDPVKWTLDFHQFLITNYKKICKCLLENNVMTKYSHERRIAIYGLNDFEYIHSVIADEILEQLLDNDLVYESLDINIISANVMKKLLVKSYQKWPKGKIYFYNEISTEGKKCNPEDLKPIFKNHWVFLYAYFNSGFPRKANYRFIFKQENEDTLYKTTNILKLLFLGIFNSREEAELMREIDFDYYQELITGENYYEDLIDDFESHSILSNLTYHSTSGLRDKQ